MKFLIITKPVRGGPPLDDPVSAYRAAKQYLSARLADGTLDCVHLTPDGGGVSIANAESVEELWSKYSGFPLSQYLEPEFIPLLDYGYFYDALIKAASGSG